MNVSAYLARIKHQGNVHRDLATLQALHTAHVMAVPFEDLDVHLKRPLSLDPDDIYTKVVTHRRGGYCYELNYLFYQLLRSIGFTCRLVSARIFTKEGRPGPEFDHLAIVVSLAEDWLVDVGYGDAFVGPLRIDDGLVQQDLFRAFKITKTDATDFLISEERIPGLFAPKYRFNLQPQRIEAFHDQHHLKQYSPTSNFVKILICTLPTPRGRKTILNGVYTETVDGVKQATPIADGLELTHLLDRHFGIVLSADDGAILAHHRPAT